MEAFWTGIAAVERVRCGQIWAVMPVIVEKSYQNLMSVS